MSNEDIIKAVLSVVHRSDTPHAVESEYIALNMNIL